MPPKTLPPSTDRPSITPRLERYPCVGSLPEIIAAPINAEIRLQRPAWFRLSFQANELVARFAPQSTSGWYEAENITQLTFYRGFIEALNVPFLNPYTLIPILSKRNLTALSLDAQNLTADALLTRLSHSLPHLHTLSLASNDLTHRGVAAPTEASRPTAPNSATLLDWTCSPK